MANRKTFTTKEPVVLDGYQAVLKPSKFGYSLSCLVDEVFGQRLD